MFKLSKAACVSSVLLVLAGATYMAGQAATASLSGTVTDASGASIPEATVTARNNGTGLSRSAVSDGQGHFSLPDLAIGDYEVQATKMGFQTVVRKGVNLTVGAAPVADFQLPVGQAEQTVTVEGSISQVETETSSVSDFLSGGRKQRISGPGGDFLGVRGASRRTRDFTGWRKSAGLVAARLGRECVRHIIGH